MAYQEEIVNTVASNTTDNAIEYNAKIGLMYVSDYGCAVSPSAWTLPVFEYYFSMSNWMYIGISEWTISHTSDSSAMAWYVVSNGTVNKDYAGPYSIGTGASSHQN